MGSYYEERTPVTSAGIQSGTMEQIHYIRADEASLAIHKIEVTVDQTTTEKTRWTSLDHIGSTTVISDELGIVEERLSYDPHGKRREADWLQASLPIRPSFTPRGFTGHEHLDAVGIIHMNGRVYDPELGRFLSADPSIPDPLYTQDSNRYSYVRNNPLSYTDPTSFVPGPGPHSPVGDRSDHQHGNYDPNTDGGWSPGDNRDGSPKETEKVEEEKSFWDYFQPRPREWDWNRAKAKGLAGLKAFAEKFTGVVGETIDEYTDIDLNTEEGWDKLHVILSVAGQAPAIGIVVDLTNATISVVRGNYTDAVLHAGSAIPVVGNGIAGTVTVAKIANKVKKATKGVSTKVDGVIDETLSGKGNITSKYSLNSDEDLDAGLKHVGGGYKEIGKQGSGVFRNADGTKQFRIDNNSSCSQ